MRTLLTPTWAAAHVGWNSVPTRSGRSSNLRAGVHRTACADTLPIHTLSVLVFLVALDAFAAAPAEKKPAPQPVLAPIQDVAGLPRVLLIGDSISMGYTLPVRKLLEGKANVHRIPENGGPTRNGMAKIDKWLGTGPWNVIHFNWGIHDLKFMPDGKRQVESEDYEQNLRALVAKLKATGAKLIWATTTPIPDGELQLGSLDQSQWRQSPVPAPRCCASCSTARNTPPAT
jgi:hypothetical protein